MALPFVGCREASSSLVARSKNTTLQVVFFCVRLGAHRRVSRLPAATAADSRDTSSKAPRFIRRRRRFGAFLVARSKKNVPQHRRVCAMRRLSNRRWRGKLKKVGRDAP